MRAITRIEKWIKGHKVLTGLIVLIAFWVPIIITHALYEWIPPVPGLASDWSAGDVLQYTTTFLSFLCTAILGLLTYRQPNLLAEKDEEYRRKQEELERERVKPVIRVRGLWRNCNGLSVTTQVRLENYSEYDAKNITISNLKIDCHSKNVQEMPPVNVTVPR